jgi:hypothetical protein
MTETFEVEPLHDNSDEFAEFFAKGHVDREAFLAQVNENWRRLGPFMLADVEHVYRHARPDPTGDKRCWYDHSHKGARGAFPATVVDAMAAQRRRWEESRRASPGAGGADEGSAT